MISRRLAHPPLVGEDDFVAVQAIHTAPVPEDGSCRSYALAGLVCCGICGRVMDSHWAYRHPAYRCRRGHSSARPRTANRPKILYVREDDLLARIRHHRQLHRQHTDLRDAGPQVIAAYLAANNMVIVGDHDSWAIETQTTTVELAAVPRFAAGIPARRDAQQER